MLNFAPNPSDMHYQLTIDDAIGSWGYSKQYVRNILAGYRGKHVDVRISSLGGDLDHGLDIRQQFVDHGDITVYITGFTASAATVIAMGAKKVCMSRYAMMLVHKCSNFIDAWGYYNADEMAALIESLEANKQENDRIDVVLATMYAEKCGKKIPDILDTLKAGRWLTASEALALGLIDEITEDAGADKMDFSADMRRKFNAFGLPPVPSEPAGTSDPDTNNDQPDMEKQSFAAVEKFLKLDGITPDKDGYVSVTAGQFASLSDRLGSLESDLAKAASEISEKDTEIARLTAQVAALKSSPAEDSPEIRDDASGGASGDGQKLSAKDLFNSIKDCL